ncbi:MAG: tripartite tricarboxylate transporter substrate binding protein [Hydrogenophaga sp.]|jgi:tripartite-type tricarboxylate transporter receptor subunit TctC|uniref:Bug family tripartite tricarboxylate transporter substrate binding protein n=1 Tax=Hydrogenophaga sp. TaxID=1904254 RepID=UPI001DAF34A2|nr:tripartite tricarboxylate transporter substrate binding protein [Hydrogenophaga sp.]MBW0169471.1 tripartite tricarboxylate transporter substrate binding protein [Hydrogenophaga sp.]MBW0182919.1 tripartite tricarboxylate transporter substrate binding protein [Hydrogenophaga sp.]
MKWKMKHWITGLALSAVAAAPALAQGKFPDNMIKLVVPFAAGGGVDNAARLLAKQLQTDLGVTVVVDNRAGGSGTIGGKAVQTAHPDGYTLLFSAATHVLASHVLAAPPYDPVTDFTPVARTGEAPLLIVIPPSAPQKNLREVIDAAKGGNNWNAAIPALGAPSHLATLLLAKQGKVNFTMTPYRGTAPAATDVAGGHVQLLVDSIISLQPMAKGGRVKPIAQTGAKRSSVAPDVPTAAESGYPGLVYVSWYGVWAPKGTPDDRVQFLNKAINKATEELTKAGSLSALGVEPVTESVDAFRKYIASDVAQSAGLLKEAGFKPE